MRYSEYCERRIRSRRRRRRLMLAAALVAGAAVLALILSDKVLPIEVWATPEKKEREVIEIDLQERVEEQTAPEPDDREEEAPAGTVPVVFIDAGHGGNDGGCFKGDIVEKDINLAIAGLVQDRLEALGYKVVMSRSDDIYVAKEDRVKSANSVNADIYISIHQNFSDVESAGGMEVWYDGTDTQRDSRRLALLVSQQTARSTGAVEREIRGDADFHVTGSTRMPSCLIETGFLSNKEERAKLVSKEYQEKLASGIVQGIEYYFHPKTMYLTFDDGPSEENTSRVLDIEILRIQLFLRHLDRLAEAVKMHDLALTEEF